MLGKTVSALTAAAMLLCFTSCSLTEKQPAVMTYGESVITEGMYSYYVSTYKARYIQAYDDISDTDEFWDGDIGTKTGEEVISELIYGNVAQNLVASEEFRRAGLTLTSEEEDAVDSYIEEMTDELASGSRKTLNGYLSEFGINVNTLREIFLMESKAEAYYRYLYGQNGEKAPTDSDRDEYFRENYVCFQQIYINTTELYETDSDGNYIQDTSGNYKKRKLTAEELSEAETKISAVKAGLEAGEDFYGLKEKYSDSKDYESGYYFSATTATNYITAVVSAAFSLEVGEWTYVEGAEENGAFFIKRLELEDGAYKNDSLSDFFDDFDGLLCEEKYSEGLEALYGDIECDEEFMDSVSVKAAPANYYYY